IPYFGEVISISEPWGNYRVHSKNESAWHTPTTRLIRREIDLFESMWAEVEGLLGPVITLKRDIKTLFTIERDLMLACFENRLFVGPLVWRYITRIKAANLRIKPKALLISWAIALLIPSARLRTYCIRAKRSPVNRPSILRSWIKR